MMAQASTAAPITWNLSGVTFSDAATASGTMTWDADSQVLSSWNISVTNGNLSAFTYTPSDSTGGDYYQGVPGFQSTFIISENSSTRQLRMTPVAALGDAGGTVGINLTTWGGGSGSIECFNCSPSRIIESGSLTTDVTPPTPEPASIGLLGLGFAGLSLLARKQQNRSR
jgi:hypothetical protein